MCDIEQDRMLGIGELNRCGDQGSGGKEGCVWRGLSQPKLGVYKETFWSSISL